MRRSRDPHDDLLVAGSGPFARQPPARVLAVVEGAVGDDVVSSVHFEGPVDSLPSADVVEHVVAVLTESLSNAVRHSGCNQVAVGLGVVDGTLTLTVVDDGVGIEPKAARSGLVNLAGRAEHLGGTFSVVAGPDGGTRLTWAVPG